MEPPLADFDLPSLDIYAAWLAAERAEIDRLRALYLARVAEAPALTAESRRRYAAEAESLGFCPLPLEPGTSRRSEEHTSELQSLMRISYAVFCLKNKNNTKHQHTCLIPRHTQ